MTAPTVDPLAREDVEAPDSYQPGDEVWVWVRHEDEEKPAWCEGTVREGGWLAVLVDYPSGIGGTATDSKRAEYVIRRELTDQPEET